MIDTSRYLAFLTYVLFPGSLTAESVSDSHLSPSFEVSSAFVSESNIVLDDSDLVVETGDHAVNNQIGAGFNGQATGNIALAGHYTWSDTRYNNTSDFDLNIQLLSLSGSYNFDRMSVGVDSFFAGADLNGRGYLRISQVGPSLGFTVGNAIYARSSLEYVERDFAQDAEKSTAGPQANLRLYYLIDQADHFLLVNYKGRKEDSSSGLFDRSVDKLELSWVKKNILLGKRIETSLTASIEQQNYLSDQPARKDQLSDFEASGIFRLNDHLYVQVSYQYLVNSSTLEEFDYQQHRAEFRVGVHL